MALEIERKFIVTDSSYKRLAKGDKHIVQAYLSTTPDATVRLRIIDDRAFITVKSRNAGCCRNEWEYGIPVADATEMITSCNIAEVIEKTRHYVEYAGRLWEIDEFAGRLDGLVVAEIELSHSDETFELPPFVGTEVTGDSRYYNSMLVSLSYPFDREQTKQAAMHV